MKAAYIIGGVLVVGVAAFALYRASQKPGTVVVNPQAPVAQKSGGWDVLSSLTQAAGGVTQAAFSAGWKPWESDQASKDAAAKASAAASVEKLGVEG